MIGAAKERRDTLRARKLEIIAELSEMKRKYICDQVEAPMSVRATLEAERDRIIAELNQLDQYIHANRKADEALAHTSLLQSLIAILKARNMGELVREAERASIDATHRVMAMLLPAPQVAA